MIANRFIMYGFFALLMLIGGTTLWLLPSWNGEGDLSFLDALFTSVSAVAVTGLITANTASFTTLGQVVVLILIQIGGLGIIAFSTLALTQSRRKISLQRRAIIREYYVGSVESEPRRIVRNIVLSTLAVEAVVMIALIPAFSSAGVEQPVWTALFHAVSAFCNAGFSLFADSLEQFVANPAVTIPIMIALVAGGLGFVVYQDLFAKAREGRRHVFSVHTRIVLFATGGLIMLGWILFLAVEWDGAFAALRPGDRVWAALFQAVTPRTAGFNTVPQGSLSTSGASMTISLMIIGGAPGSIAGGVKVTTIFIALLAAFGRTDEDGTARVFHRKIPVSLVSRAQLFIIRAALIVVGSFLALTISENLIAASGFSFQALLFETVSAFGTVGLSVGITPELSSIGKIIIMVTMFAGRVGLISLAIPPRGKQWEGLVDYPKGEVLIG
jgi:trk system potassium uptake protein TrkH